MPAEASAFIRMNNSSGTVKILRSRSQYQCCHIKVSDTLQQLPAVVVEGACYSFFKVEFDEQHALNVAAKLSLAGDRVIVTQAPKCFVIWVFEPDAKPTRLLRQPKSMRAVPNSKAYRIVVSTDNYQNCRVNVPDLAKPIAAIAYEGKYYSLFKMVEDIQHATQLIRRLRYRGDETVITKTSNGYAIWLVEPDARLV